MIRILLITSLLAACGDNIDPTPDAGTPSCASVGCPGALLCSSPNACTCPQPDGTQITCKLTAPSTYPACSDLGCDATTVEQTRLCASSGVCICNAQTCQL